MSTITTTYQGDMLFQSTVGNHTITIDVPDSMGGTERGIMPPQLFIVSLGSCVAALITDYCNNHNIDATGLKVDVSFDKQNGRLENIRTTVKLPNADVKKRERALQNVAKHCPVHATITGMDHMDIVIEDKTAMADAFDQAG